MVEIEFKIPSKSRRDGSEIHKKSPKVVPTGLTRSSI
jgi:hypothetical protein